MIRSPTSTWPLGLLLLVACSGDAAHEAPPVPVTVARVDSRTVPVQVEAVGHVEPASTVTVHALVGGELQDVGFTEGAAVQQGDTLFVIDPRPYQAALAKAQATLQRDRVQAEQARSEATRNKALADQNYVSPDQLAQFEATAAADEALVSADEATVQSARLDLSHCTIHAAISGRTGALLVHAGNLVKANDTAMVVINQVQPVRVTFSVPEQYLPPIQAHDDGQDGLVVTSTISRESDEVRQGTLHFVDNTIDPTTGTIGLKADFANDDLALWPGQFTRVTLTLGQQDGALVVPTQAVQDGQDGTYVYTVGPDDTVKMVPVQVDRTFGWGQCHPPGPVGRGHGRGRRAAVAAPRGQGDGKAGRGAELNITALFIRRPVMTLLVMFSLLLFGIMGYRSLPVSDLPNVDFPTIQVSASLPGASPDTMASAVATPLERQFSTIAGLDSMTSSSATGGTQITLQFSLSRELDAAAQDVQAAISSAGGQLPQGMPSPPSLRKVNPADQPVLYLALTSPTLPISQLDEYGETMMAERISTVSGVAQVQVYGSQKYAVRVQLDPNALQAHDLGIDEVARAIQSGNVNLPTGTLYGPHKAFTVQADGQLTDAAAYRPLTVAWRDGAPVRLAQLGTVTDSVENDKTAAWFIDQRSVILAVQRQPGTNTVDVVQAIRDLLPSFQQALPANASLHIVHDRSESIKSSFSDVKFTLLLTLCLVVMVIFLFLRSVSATVIPAMALPMSIVGTFAVMYLFGYSLDNLSMMALTLSVGFVVDDAIVMLENIVRHVEKGEGILEASLKGSREIAFTILSMTLSLTAVFIPVLFMGGILGRLFHEFAVTIGAAILISGFVSLTLTPLLCSFFLRHETERQHGAAYKAVERAFEASLAGYSRGLSWSLDHVRIVLLGSLVVLIATVGLFIRIPKGFLPTEDSGMIMAFTEAQEGTSFKALAAHQQELAAIVQANPYVKSFISTCGARGPTGSNTGILFMHLQPRSQRPSAQQIITMLRPQIGQVVGMRAFMQIPPPIRIGGHLTKSQYQYTLQSTDQKGLFDAVPAFEAKMRDLPGLADVTTDLQIKNPQIDVHIDRDAASALGVTAEQIESALYDAYGSRQVSTIYAPNNEYRVLMELEPGFQQDPTELSRLQIRSNSGKLVPLQSVARLGQSLGPLVINHMGQLPAVTVSFDLQPGVSLSQATAEVDKLARQALPAGVTTSFQGAAEAFQSSLRGLGLLFLVAVMVIYIVLGILYESFIHPVTILSALPFAGFGALVTLMLFHTELSVYAFVGIIMLIGLVKKNGIMMVDFAVEAQRTQGLSARDAIYEACRVRFRPIMMTTMAALAGTLPIALGLGAGAESRQPLGLAVVGGLVFSQVLTLFVTPVFFLVNERLGGGLEKRLARGQQVEVTVQAE